MRKGVFAVVCLVLSAWPAAAQEITGSVFGTVMDKSGAIVSGATVTIENADKNDTVIRVVTTNDNGDFVVQFLPDRKSVV